MAQAMVNETFEGIGHTKTAMVKGESVLLTILSKLWFVFSLIAFLNSALSFLISLRRFEFTPSGVLGHLFWTSLSLSRLVFKRLSSCCSRCLISWFCLVSSSTVAASVWICRVNATGSWLALDFTWTYKLTGMVLLNLSAKKSFPTDSAKLMMLRSSVKMIIQ